MRDTSRHEQINMRHLLAFMVTAQNGNVSKAAVQLFKAQSAVSRSVRELEATLSVTLLEKTKGRLLCTPFGNAVLDRAIRAHQELKAGLAEVIREVGRRGPASAATIAALFNEARLVYIAGVAESGRVASVAASLGVSQAAVSSAIASVEAALQLPLFERAYTGMRLTKCGEILLFRCKRALAEVRSIRPDIDALNNLTSGHVSVGVLPLGRTFVLPRAVGRVLKTHSRLRVTIVDGTFPVLAAALRRGDIDFVFGALRPGYAPDLSDESLYEIPLKIMVRKGHPLASQSTVTLEQLANVQWALPRATPGRQLLDRFFSDRGLASPLESVETGDLAMLRGLLLDTDMVTAVAAKQFEYELASGHLEVLPIDLPETTRAVGLTQRTDSRASPGALALIREIRRAVEEVTDSSDAQGALRDSR